MATLDSCRNELRSIINELKAIEEGIRYQFVGIGQEHCADCLDTLISKYRNILNRLNNVDSNRLADFINGEV